MEKGLGQLCLWGGGSSAVKGSPFSSPLGSRPASTLPLTCSPWGVRRGRAPRLVVVVGVIFLTKPPLRPLLPDTHEASSLRSSPASGTTKCLVPEPTIHSKHHGLLSTCGVKRPRHLGSASEQRVVGPWGAFWVLIKGQAKDHWGSGDKYPHRCRGSRCRAGAGPPQACHPGGENGPELGRQAGCSSSVCQERESGTRVI